MMAYKMLPLIINARVVPAAACETLTQRIAPVGGFTGLRLARGGLVHQETWRRWSTVISGSGPHPAALAGIDWSAPLTVDCIEPLVVSAATPSLALPTARRADAPVRGFAVLADGSIESTPVALAGSAATLTAVAGAVAYEVSYFPILVLPSAQFDTQYDRTSATAGWSITGEE